MEGILTGCDREQEWMLSWWYQNLRKYNPDISIAFGDLGMSDEAKSWCEKRGILIPASQIRLISPPPSYESGWLYGGNRWHMNTPARTLSWFRKPFLMKESPFDRTVWLDLDCQVLNRLAPLFSIRLPETKLAIRSGPEVIKMISDDHKYFLPILGHNSGVVVFEKESSLLDFWIFLTSQAYPHFFGDDCILSFAICKYHFQIGKIPYKYNWLIQWGNNSEAAILHWMGSAGKMFLKLQLLAP